MAKMNKQGFSNVPVLDSNLFMGVFSTSTVFEYILKNPENPINFKTTIRDIYRNIDIKNHSGNYVFVPINSSLLEARKIFERVEGKNRRVSVIFITKNGKSDERILGLLTPWDLMGDK